MENLKSIKVDKDDFTVEFDILSMPSKNLSAEQIMLQREVQEIDESLGELKVEIDKMNTEIDRLTNHADGVDYATAVTCGLITGLIDSLWVGEWNFKEAKATSNEDVNNKVKAFAKKDPAYAKYLSRRKGENNDPDRLANAISFLEQKYRLPGDGDFNFKGSGVTAKSHHLDDFCHHPTLFGMISCILVQFTGEAKYRASTGNVVKVAVEINEYNLLVSDHPIGKIFAGIINWFIRCAETIKNQKGHLMSDVAGSKSSVHKNNAGAGVPGGFLSTVKELASLDVFKGTDLASDLRKAYENGIGEDGNKLDLGAFNTLFEGASSKVDYRTERAIKGEIKRQSVPVIINEILVRASYFIRRLIKEAKIKNSIREIEFKKLIPVNNRTIVRMCTIATGTFSAVDLADATLRAAVKSGGNPEEFLRNMVLRVNFVGVGRLAIAIGTDTAMGVKKSRSESNRRGLLSQEIMYKEAKLYYSHANMWIEVKKTEESMKELYETVEKSVAFFIETHNERVELMDKCGEHIDNIREHNPDYIKELEDLLLWGE